MSIVIGCRIPQLHHGNIFHIFGGYFSFSNSDFFFLNGTRASLVHQCSMLFSKYSRQLRGELEIGIILYVLRELAGSPPRSRRGNGGLSTGLPHFWPCTCRGSAESTGAVVGDSVGGSGGDPVFVTAREAARDSVSGAGGDPAVAVAGEAASDSTGGAGGDPVVGAAGWAAGDSAGVGGRRWWRSGGCRDGGGGGGLGGRRRRGRRQSGAGRG